MKSPSLVEQHARRSGLCALVRQTRRLGARWYTSSWWPWQCARAQELDLHMTKYHTAALNMREGLSAAKTEF